MRDTHQYSTKNSDTPTVLLEGHPISRALMTELAETAQAYTSLKVDTSLHPFDSDHVPFIEARIPAVLTIEGDDSSNPHEHTANDTLAYINYELAIDFVRMIVAATASLETSYAFDVFLNEKPPLTLARVSKGVLALLLYRQTNRIALTIQSRNIATHVPNIPMLSNNHREFGILLERNL